MSLPKPVMFGAALLALALLAGCNTEDWDTRGTNDISGGWDDINFHRGDDSVSPDQPMDHDHGGHEGGGGGHAGGGGGGHGGGGGGGGGGHR